MCRAGENSRHSITYFVAVIMKIKRRARGEAARSFLEAVGTALRLRHLKCVIRGLAGPVTTGRGLFSEEPISLTTVQSICGKETGRATMAYRRAACEIIIISINQRITAMISGGLLRGGRSNGLALVSKTWPT